MPFDELIANEYREASLRQLDMVAIAASFEAVRRARPGSVDMLRAANTQLAGNGSSAVRSAIRQLRTGLARDYYAQRREDLVDALREDPQEGWTQWLRTFVVFVTETPGRLHRWMAEDEWPVAGVEAEQFTRLRRFTRLVAERRWMDVRETFERLGADQRLEPRSRGVALEGAAMIWLHIMEREEIARECLVRADELATDCAHVAMGWGEYWVKRALGSDGEEREQAIEEARAAVQRARELDPLDSRALLILSDLERAVANAEESRKLLREALSMGSADACFDLVDLALDDAPAGADDPVVRSMIDLVMDMAYDRDDEISAMVRIADVLASRQQTVAAAEAWYLRAIDAGPNRVLVHVAFAFALLDQGRLTEARKRVLHACDLDPDAFEVWNALAWVTEAEGDHTAAIDCLRRALERQPSFEPELRARISGCLIKLNRLDEAEHEATLALHVMPANRLAVSSVKQLAEIAYTDHDDVEQALRMYEVLRQFGGSGERSSYHNLRGNLFYSRSDYTQAVAEYESAVALKPRDEILWSNLATACESAATGSDDSERLLVRSEVSWEQAVELGQRAESEVALERVRARLAVLRRCGGEALERVPVVTPSRVGLSDDLVEVVRDPSTGDLLDAAKARIEQMRARLRATTGVPVPGVRFGYAGNQEAPDPWLEMSIFGVPVHGAPIVTDPVDPMRSILAAVEEVLRRHFEYFLDQQSIRSALDSETDADVRAIDSHALVPLARAARERARRGQPISWCDLVRDVYVLDSDQPSATPSDGVASRSP